MWEWSRANSLKSKMKRSPLSQIHCKGPWKINDDYKIPRKSELPMYSVSIA